MIKPPVFILFALLNISFVSVGEASASQASEATLVIDLDRRQPSGDNQTLECEPDAHFRLSFDDDTVDLTSIPLVARAALVRMDVPADVRGVLRLISSRCWAPQRQVSVGQGETYVGARVFAATEVSGRVIRADGGSFEGNTEPIRLTLSEPLDKDIRFQLPTVTSDASCNWLDEPGSGRIEDAKNRHLDRSFSCMVPQGSWDLRLRLPGFVSHHFWKLSLGAKTTELPELKLQAGASAKGWIIASSGIALDEALVKLVPRPSFTPEHTDLAKDVVRRDKLRTFESTVLESGFFHLTGAKAGEYSVQVSHENGATGESPWIELRDGVESVVTQPIELAVPRPVDLVIEPTLDPSGEPWRVDVSPFSPGAIVEPLHSGEADYSGNWTIPGLKKGKYVITLKDSSEVGWFSELYDVEDGQDLLMVEARILQLSGTVKVGSQRLRNANLTFFARGGLKTEVKTDSKGQYSAWLKDVNDFSVLAVDGTLDENSIKRRLDFRVPRDVRGSLTKNFRLPNGRLRGRVVNEEGEGVHSAVFLTFLHGERARTVITQSDGTWEANSIQPGEVRAAAWDMPGGRRSEQLPAKVQDGSFGADVVLTLKKTRTITGRVTGASGAVAGAKLLIEPAQAPLSLLGQATTDEEGAFEIEVPAGTHELNVTVLDPHGSMRVLRVALPDESHGTHSSPISIRSESTSGSVDIDFREWDGHDFYSGYAHVFVRPDRSWTLLENMILWASSKGETFSEFTRQQHHRLEAGRYRLCRIPISELWQSLTQASPKSSYCSSFQVRSGSVEEVSFAPE